METKKISPGEQKDEQKIVAHIVRALKSIRYGYVHITVQDEKVVQIEKSEKVRFDKAGLSWYS